MEVGSLAPCLLTPRPVGVEVLGFGTGFLGAFEDFPFPLYVPLPIPLWLGMGLARLYAGDPLDTFLAGGFGACTCRDGLIGPKSPEVSSGALKEGVFLAEGPGLQKSSCISSGVTSRVMTS